MGLGRAGPRDLVLALAHPRIRANGLLALTVARSGLSLIALNGFGLLSGLLTPSPYG